MRLATRAFGSGGRRILLLHGITSNASGWWRVGADLAADGWAVTAVDFRGHGETGPASSYLFGEHAADVLAVGDHWEAVLGHSMGGAIAVLASSIRPDWADGLILQDPALAMPPSIDEVTAWLLDDYQRPITLERIAAESPQWAPQDVVAKVGALESAPQAVIAETIRANWPWMVLDETVRLTVPTVIIGSDPSTGGLFPVALGRWLETTNPGISYEMLEGSSHSAHRDTDVYETYLKTLIAGLARLPTLGRKIDEGAGR